MMLSIQSNGVNLHVRDDGPKDAQVLMFSNSLGTDMQVWDLLLAHLPTEDYRVVRYDKRGHGLSDCPDNWSLMQRLLPIRLSLKI